MKWLMGGLLLGLVLNVQPTEFQDDFERREILQEVGAMEDSTNPDWWLSSGGWFVVEDGEGKTVQGDLPSEDFWRERYAQTKPDETNKGYNPQNIFRLVLRSQWLNFRQQVYFRIREVQASTSPYRNGSNGIFLMNRYADQDNLYYVGVRVDGQAVIKKKINGTYYTMALTQVYSGQYDRARTLNLLPVDVFIGLRSELRTLADDTVEIRLYLDRDETWELILTAIDDGISYGGNPFLHPGYAGIRSDFMDVEFDNYRITNEEK